MKHNRVHADFWDDTLTWPEDERLVALYLLTCRGRNTEGLFRFRVDHAALDLGWTVPRLQAAIDDLGGRGWAILENGWMLLVKSLRWEPPKGDNQCRGAASKVSTVPRSSDVYARFYEVASRYAPDLVRFLEAPSDPLQNMSEGASEGREGASPSYSSPTPSPTRTPPPLQAALTAPAEVRRMLVDSGFDELEVEQADGAIRLALSDLRLPDDVDWWRFGQEIQKARQAGRMRRANPGSALRFIARGASGPPRLSSPNGKTRHLSPVEHYAAMAREVHAEGGDAA